MTTTRIDRAVPWAPFLAVLAALAVPAAAGEGHEGEKKCEATAEACVHAMAENLRNRGWVGIEMSEADDEGRPLVTRVVEGSPAEAAGFRPGDALTAFNGVPHARGKEAVNAEVKRSMVPGRTITMSVLRDGEPRELEVVLGRIPDYLLAQWIGHHMLESHSTVAGSDAESDSESDPARP